MNPLTRGAHHIGLTVSDLEKSVAFFTSILGWDEVGRNDDYPAIFVSDGNTMVTLWKNKTEPYDNFDRHGNIGLHHLALKVEDESRLNEIHDKLRENNVKIEFPPEPLGGGPIKHMMCYEPNGIRIEFIWPG